jgi:hypothetical protein
MFYLRVFFRNFYLAPVRILFFILYSVLVINLLGQKDNVEKHVFKMLKEDESGSYFHALISGKENSTSVMRKLSSLPGVQKVELISENKIAKEVKNMLGGIELSVAPDILVTSYSGLKVVFEAELKTKSQMLIKEYLSRLVGEDSITIGPTKTYDFFWKRVQFITGFIEKWGGLYWTSTLIGFWIVLFVFTLVLLKKQGHLMELYQRRKNVTFKNIMMILSFISVASILPLSILPTPNWIIYFSSIAALLCMGFWGLPKYEWQD